MRIILIAMLLVFSVNAKSLFSNDLKVQSTKYIGALKDLIISTQKTRGLTNTYLNGNTASMLLVYDSRENMKKAIAIMEGLPLSADPIINSKATSISQSLMKLNTKAFKTDSHFIFKAYTQEIEQLLMLAQSVSKRNIKDLNPLGHELSIVMMEVMLPLTEYISQMRGMGSGITAKKNITKVQHDKMRALSRDIKIYTQNLVKDIETIRSKYARSCDPTIEIKLTRMQSASNKYLILTDSKILATKKISYDADKYFEDGTSLISKIIDIYDMTNNVIINDSKGWL